MYLHKSRLTSQVRDDRGGDDVMSVERHIPRSLSSQRDGSSSRIHQPGGFFENSLDIQGTGNSSQSVPDVSNRTRGGVSIRVLVPGTDDSIAPDIVTVEMMNRWYDFETAVMHSCDIGTYLWNNDLRHRTVVVLDNRSYRLFVRTMPCLTIAQLRRLASTHLLTVPSKMTKPRVYERLREHECGSDCDQACVILIQRRNERVMTVMSLEAIGTAASFAGSSSIRGRTSQFCLADRTLHIETASDFPEMYSEDLRLSVIHEWQEMMDIRQWMRRTCAVCGQLKFPSEVKSKALSDAALDALVDNTLDECHFPPEYEFFAYRRALLHPNGMLSWTTRDAVLVCTSCNGALSKNRMPRDAIANKQYYAFGCLPASVQAAFRQASSSDL
ncbi:hypothetical protein K488DRAFT_75212, partial [Vararia minispora EC-137]